MKTSCTLLIMSWLFVCATSCSLQAEKQHDNVSIGEASLRIEPSTPAQTRITKPTNDSENPCQNAVTQMELNDCATLEFKKVDIELNQLYKQLTATLETEDKLALDKVQRTWISYRDINCRAEYNYNDGSIAPMLYGVCLKENTKDRIKELRRIYVQSN